MKQETFLQKAKNIYGDKFDLSKVEYTGCNNKILVVCPVHGEFTTSPQYFLEGKGCIKCNHHENFVKQATKMHNGKYDYSKVVYEHCNTPVCIICPEHGEFYQKPFHHLTGCGCPECGKIKSAKKNTLTSQEFVNKAQIFHGNKYDYSKSNYVDFNTPVCIICPEHGEFWQKPAQHLRGHGCTKCYQDMLDANQNIHANNFKKFMINKFGDIIDFSEMVYKNATTPITLICKKDGVKITKTPIAFKQNDIFCKFCLKPTKEITNVKVQPDYKQIFLDKLEIKHPERFELIGDYVNRDTKIQVLDKKSNNILCITPRCLLRWKDPSTIPENRQYNFIKKSNRKHNSKYDYSKVKYTNSKIKVCIVCPEHGEFWQTPKEHLQGSGCPKCARNTKWDFDEFLQEVKRIHGNKYNYDKTVLKLICDKITVTCPIHGDFEVRAHNHLQGAGCQKCKGSGGEQILMNFFDNENVPYEYNKFYSWLNNMQLDFYFPEHKLAIEVQGEQHFREISAFNTSFEAQCIRDEKKRILCEENGITLLYYAPYKYDFPYMVFTDINDLWTEIKRHFEKN